jgi:hypothetical protein
MISLTTPHQAVHRPQEAQTRGDAAVRNPQQPRGAEMGGLCFIPSRRCWWVTVAVRKEQSSAQRPAVGSQIEGFHRGTESLTVRVASMRTSPRFSGM